MFLASNRLNVHGSSTMELDDEWIFFTSWLSMFRLRRSPLNPGNKHYRLCSCVLSITETHILLECDLNKASRQVMLNSIINILLKEQVFTLSQLNELIQATWNRILSFRHVKLKRLSSLQLYDAVCYFLLTALS